MPSLSSRLQTLTTFILEIGLLYVVIFFIQAQPAYGSMAAFLTAAMIPLLAFYAHRLEKTFNIPFFVWAIGLGFIFKNTLTPLTSSPANLAWFTTFLGILIIFGGGLELKFSSFKRLMFPILSLSIIGATITAFLFSASLSGLTSILNLPLSIGTIGLLGAMLCSTDPAAILPTLKRLKLKNPDDKTLAISESAVNDVLGTIITSFFAALTIDAVVKPQSLTQLYSHLFGLEIVLNFTKEIFVGVIIGYLAYHLLSLWKKFGTISLASFPFLIGIALTSFLLSSIWGGSGYLAVFITGLLFELEHDYKEVEHFFVNLVDGFVKPAVFVILGSLIVSSFLTYAGLGILISAAFIFIIRPIAVTLSLGWFTGKGKIFTIGDMLFFDVVRETGVIPAVLLVAYLPFLPDGELAFAVGTWVILSTLIILPLLTGYWAKRLKVITSDK